MSYSVTASFAGEQVKKEDINIINMYVVNASLSGWDPLYYTNYNQNIYGFSMNASGDLLAAETLYTGLPIKHDSIKNNLQGEISNVSITIPNVDRVMESYIKSYDYLRGREVYILTFFSKHLPTGGSAEYIGETSDRFAGMKEKMYIDSTVSTEESVTFSCKPKFLIKNKILPGRTFSRECAWVKDYNTEYHTRYCDPTSSINLTTYPTCDGTLNNCIERNNRERFGGFPSIPEKAMVIV